MLISIWLLCSVRGETFNHNAAAAAPTNSTLCEACALCETCQSCIPPIILTFAITAIVTTLLLASIYVPVLIVVFKSYSKVIPETAKNGTTVDKELEGDVREQVDEGEKGEGGQEGGEEGGGGGTEGGGGGEAEEAGGGVRAESERGGRVEGDEGEE